MKTLKEYSLYTFERSKLIWTETENLEQAIHNFRERIDINHNGYYHPQMNYVFNPINIITKRVDDREIVLKQDLKAIEKQLLKG